MPNTTFYILVTNYATIPTVLSGVYDTGFLNDVADTKVGATYVTFFACVMNLSSMYPTTLGYAVVKSTGVENLVWICVGVTAVIFVAGYWAAKAIDECPIENYLVITDEGPTEADNQPAPNPEAENNEEVESLNPKEPENTPGEFGDVKNRNPKDAV